MSSLLPIHLQTVCDGNSSANWVWRELRRLWKGRFHLAGPARSTIFKNVTQFSYEQLSQKLRELAYLNSGLTIAIRDERTARFFATYRRPLADWRSAKGFTQKDYALRNASWHVADIFADPHMTARGDLVTVEDPVLGPVRQQAPFPRFVGAEPPVPTGAPRLGEHNDEVWGSLGVDPHEQARLHTDGIL